MSKFNQLEKYILIICLTSLLLFWGPPLAIGTGLLAITLSAIYIYNNSKKEFYLKSLLIPFSFTITLFIFHIPTSFMLVGWEREILPLIDLIISVPTLILSAIINGIICTTKS